MRIFTMIIFLSLLLSVGFSARVFAIGTPGKDVSDHALFDETSGDTGCTCSSDKTYVFSLSCQAVVGGGDAKIRVTFNDLDFIEYPIADGQSFSLTQAAGGTKGVDGALVVTNSLGGKNLVCWCSILTQTGAHPLATTAPDFCTTQ